MFFAANDVQEEEYANRLIQEFKSGLLPLTDGTTLRTFLSKLLNCDPMRISKKFVGSNCIGKQVQYCLQYCAVWRAGQARCCRDVDVSPLFFFVRCCSFSTPSGCVFWLRLELPRPCTNQHTINVDVYYESVLSLRACFSVVVRKAS